MDYYRWWKYLKYNDMKITTTDKEIYWINEKTLQSGITEVGQTTETEQVLTTFTDKTLWQTKKTELGISDVIQ